MRWSSRSWRAIPIGRSSLEAFTMHRTHVKINIDLFKTILYMIQKSPQNKSRTQQSVLFLF
jgi:hypothetical protein